jgi:hypothetical protein
MQKTFNKLKVEITDPKKDSFIIYNDCKVVFNITDKDLALKIKMKILYDDVLIFSIVDHCDSMDNDTYYFEAFHHLDINNINNSKQDKEIYLYNNNEYLNKSLVSYRPEDSFGWFNNMLPEDYSMFTDSKDLCFMVHCKEGFTDNKLLIEIHKNDELSSFLDTIIKKYTEDLNNQTV